jgi:hypothetical protein
MTNLILTTGDSIKLREFLKAKLSVGTHEIVFEKKDKSIRVLRGTRDAALISAELFEQFMNPPPRKDGAERSESTTSLPTFDVEASAWRSFSFDKLISVDGINIDTVLKQADIDLEV